MNKPRVDLQHLFLSSLDNLMLVGDVLVMIAYTVFASLGVPTALVLAVIVEQQRVMHGIGLFEADDNLAVLGSWVLVIINLAFEFQAHHTEHRAGYKGQEAARFSVRLLIAQLAYTLGVGRSWQAQMHSPARRYYIVGRIVTLTILALALGGSMKAQFESETGAWHTAIVNVLTTSTLSEMATWAGGLLFALAAVISAQASSRYIATRFVEVRNQQRYRKQAERAVPMVVESVRPVWGEYRRADLQPTKVKVGSTTKYKCPDCEKVMSRQAWANHPCRLTDVAPVLDVLDRQVDTLDGYVDVSTVNEDVKYATPVKQAVNGHHIGGDDR